MWISTTEHKDLQNQNEDLIAPSAILENKFWGSHQQTNAEGGKKHGSQMSINDSREPIHVKTCLDRTKKHMGVQATIEIIFSFVYYPHS